jgi:hypothetical protein
VDGRPPTVEIDQGEAASGMEVDPRRAVALLEPLLDQPV